MNKWFYKIALIVLLVSLEMAMVELSFLISTLIVLLLFRDRISGKAVVVILLLFVLFLIGMIPVFKPENDYYHFIKDVIYFLRPITVLLAVYFLVMRMKDRHAFFNMVVLLGFLYAGNHVFRILAHLPNIQPDVTILRNSFGRYNHIESVAVIIIICIRDLQLKRTRYTIVYKAMVGLLFLSYLLYFSRTMILVTLMVCLAYYGFLKLNRRGLIAIGFFAVFAGISGYFISQYDPPEDSTNMFDGFILKIKNSYAETFSLDDINVYDLDRRSLWKRWRAYESSLVIKEVDQQRKWLTGEGFGSTIDIGFEAYLGGDWTRDISLTHSGFAYVYLKTGILGILVYLLIPLYLYSFAYFGDRKRKGVRYNNLLVGVAFYILITTFVVTGLYKPYDMAMVLAGAVFALKELDNRENRDTGNQGNT
jgi:hypothetical protein